MGSDVFHHLPDAVGHFGIPLFKKKNQRGESLTTDFGIRVSF